jgi:hypothetical protein
MGKRRDTKRNVDLISSHSEEEDEGPCLMSSSELDDPLTQPVSTTTSGTYDPPHVLPFKLKPGETLVHLEEYIPDVDRNEYS